jgi:hypothetical protein
MINHKKLGINILFHFISFDIKEIIDSSSKGLLIESYLKNFY